MAEATKGEDQNEGKRLKVLRRSRTGKKGSITKRINQLDKFVSEKGGRRATEMMLKGLQDIFKELEKVCLEISDLCDEEDQLNDIEEIRFNVETCVAMATEYLDARREDPPSEASSIALSWVRKHMGQFGVNDDDEVSSNHSEPKVSVSEPGMVKGPTLHQHKRYTYSVSRPPTPRVLPQIPSFLDNQVSVLGNPERQGDHGQQQGDLEQVETQEDDLLTDMA